MIERVVHGIIKKQEELRAVPFDASAPNAALYEQHYWRVQGLQDAIEVINELLREDDERGRKL